MGRRIALLAAGILALASAPASAASTELRANLLKDIRSGPASSYPSLFAATFDRAVFAASTGKAGREVWSTDGTEDGTRLIADIFPGRKSSDPRSLTSIGKYVFFTAENEHEVTRLWQSDGTPAGTRPVAGTKGLRVASPHAGNGVALFRVFRLADGTRVREVWAADGESPAVPIGIPSFSDIMPALGTTFFRSSDDEHGTELWRTNGTASGTRLVKDVVPGPGDSDPAGLSRYRDRAFFFASAPDGAGSDLWRTDGTEAGTVRIATLDDSFVSGSDFTGFSDGRLLFTLGNQELWRTDGTAAGTDFTGVHTRGRFVYMEDRIGGVQYMDIDTNLWRTDGTESGTVPVAEWLYEPSRLDELAGVAVFVAGSRKVSQELFQSDGTKKGTRLVRDIWPGARRGSRIAWLTELPGRVVFTAYDGQKHGQELWVVEPDRGRRRAG